MKYPGAVPDRKLLQISVTSCSDAKWRKNELLKLPSRKDRWDLSEAGIDLAMSGPIFVKYSQKRLAIWVGLNISSSLDLKKEGNLHLLFLLIRSLSNFQVDFALDLYSYNFLL